MTSAERLAMHRLIDAERRLERAQRRIAYLKRDKERALTRARRAEDDVWRLKGRLFLMGVISE